MKNKTGQGKSRY